MGEPHERIAGVFHGEGGGGVDGIARLLPRFAAYLRLRRRASGGIDDASWSETPAEDLGSRLLEQEVRHGEGREARGAGRIAARVPASFGSSRVGDFLAVRKYFSRCGRRQPNSE